MVTLEDIKKHPRVKVYIEQANHYLGVIGYTEHGYRHADFVANLAKDILAELGKDAETAELAAIAGYLHDIGNLMGRNFHEQSGALVSLSLLEQIKMPDKDIAVVIGAIGNHEDEVNDPANEVTAAVLLADKSDVHRSRVRNKDMIKFDIHDRVNYAAERSFLKVDRKKKEITLELTIDTKISQVMEYFEIFMNRMLACSKSASCLGCTFSLVINKVRLF